MSDLERLMDETVATIAEAQATRAALAEFDPVSCSCERPNPNLIGECRGCRRRVVTPEMLGGDAACTATLTSRLFDPDTAVDAGETVRPHLPAMQAEVLAVLGRWLNGATAYEVMVDLNRTGRGRQQNSIVKRCRELAGKGFVVDSGRTRPGGSGRQLIVWACTIEGATAAQ